jgi:hypothetical protein
MLAGLATGVFIIGMVGIAEAALVGSAPVPWNSHWYYIISDDGGADVSWTAANAYTSTDGYDYSYLVTINNAAENDWLWKSSDLGVGTYDDHWIGYYQTETTDEPGGNWAWVNGETPGYENWNTGEPNNASHGSGIGEDYAVFNVPGHGLWGDQWNEAGVKFAIVEAVPLPAAVYLFGTGLVALVLMKRRRVDA